MENTYYHSIRIEKIQNAIKEMFESYFEGVDANEFINKLNFKAVDAWISRHQSGIEEMVRIKAENTDETICVEVRCHSTGTITIVLRKIFDINIQLDLDVDEMLEESQ